MKPFQLAPRAPFQLARGAPFHMFQGFQVLNPLELRSAGTAKRWNREAVEPREDETPWA